MKKKNAYNKQRVLIFTVFGTAISIWSLSLFLTTNNILGLLGFVLIGGGTIKDVLNFLKNK
jgi:hypothetical protein